MNFLAHSLLGFDNSELITGQFCGDFVRGSDLSAFPDDVQTGIRLHRFLDGFTDRHPIMRQQRKGIELVPRRLCGILLDVLFDHYLAVNWSKVSAATLAAHTERVQQALAENEACLPASLKRFIVYMRREDVLQSNQHLPFIALTLQRIASRSTALDPLVLSPVQLEPLADQLTTPFEQFYPELHAAALHYVKPYPILRSQS
ncbi:MAG: ACP phosphodiesterase [Granulosicoccus sp.]